MNSPIQLNEFDNYSLDYYFSSPPPHYSLFGSLESDDYEYSTSSSTASPCFFRTSPPSMPSNSSSIIITNTDTNSTNSTNSVSLSASASKVVTKLKTTQQPDMTKKKRNQIQAIPSPPPPPPPPPLVIVKYTKNTAFYAKVIKQVSSNYCEVSFDGFRTDSYPGACFRIATNNVFRNITQLKQEQDCELEVTTARPKPLISPRLLSICTPQQIQQLENIERCYQIHQCVDVQVNDKWFPAVIQSNNWTSISVIMDNWHADVAKQDIPQSQFLYRLSPIRHPHLYHQPTPTQNNNVPSDSSFLNNNNNNNTHINNKPDYEADAYYHDNSSIPSPFNWCCLPSSSSSSSKSELQTLSACLLYSGLSVCIISLYNHTSPSFLQQHDYYRHCGEKETDDFKLFYTLKSLVSKHGFIVSVTSITPLLSNTSSIIGNIGNTASFLPEKTLYVYHICYDVLIKHDAEYVSLNTYPYVHILMMKAYAPNIQPIASSLPHNNNTITIEGLKQCTTLKTAERFEQELDRIRYKKRKLNNCNSNSNNTNASDGGGDGNEAKMELEEWSRRAHLDCILQDYQLQTVKWLITQETKEGGINSTLFTRLTFKGVHSHIHFYYSPLLGCFLFRPLMNVYGGWLISEMGLGKTVEMITLIQLTKPQPQPQPQPQLQLQPEEVPKKAPSGRYITHGTLIIVPVAVIGQWELEIKTKCKSSQPLSVCVLYGSRRRQIATDLLKYDVVITSLETMASLSRNAQMKRNSISCDQPWEYKGDHALEYYSVLEQIHWHRIIVDESHRIRLSNNKVQFQYLYRLLADRRWLLSGTVIDRSIEDLKLQCMFLRLYQSNQSRLWDNISTCIVNNKTKWNDYYAERINDYNSLSSSKSSNDVFNYWRCHPTIHCAHFLIHLFSHLMIRHEHNQSFNGRSLLLPLPPTQFNTILVQFTPEQQQTYDNLQQYVKQQYMYLKQAGRVNRYCLNLLRLITTLRQFCSVSINDAVQQQNTIWNAAAATATSNADVDDDNNNNNNNTSNKLVLKEFIEQIQKKPHASLPAFGSLDDECAICLEMMNEPFQTTCRHLFCSSCIYMLFVQKQQQQQRGCRCPSCRTSLHMKDITKPCLTMINDRDDDDDIYIQEQKEEKKEKKTEEVRNVTTTTTTTSSSTSSFVYMDAKLQRLMQELDDMKRIDPSAKALVFTQFSYSFQEVVRKLKSNNARIGFQMLSSSMSMSRRTKAINSFQHDDSISVLVLNVNSAANGLNLTAATHIFLMDPCMNFGLEDQAISRVRRFTQTRPTYVHYLIMKDTIEETIMKINKLKRSSSPSITPTTTSSSSYQQIGVRDFDLLFQQ